LCRRGQTNKRGGGRAIEMTTPWLQGEGKKSGNRPISSIRTSLGKEEKERGGKEKTLSCKEKKSSFSSPACPPLREEREEKGKRSQTFPQPHFNFILGLSEGRKEKKRGGR